MLATLPASHGNSEIASFLNVVRWTTRTISGFDWAGSSKVLIGDTHKVHVVYNGPTGDGIIERETNERFHNIKDSLKAALVYVMASMNKNPLTKADSRFRGRERFFLLLYVKLVDTFLENKLIFFSLS